MKTKIWQEFCVERNKYRKVVEKLTGDLPLLGKWQKKLVEERDGPDYKIETPVVYNTVFDKVNENDTIKLILVADNPGRREQEAANRCYLTGPSGKIAARFFREHPELETDFYQNVLILNKTPIHTPRTADLAELCKTGGAKMENALHSSQIEMAELLLSYHRLFAPVPVWIIGYSEMKKGGIFETYTNYLKEKYSSLPARRDEVFFFRHFSMNQFTIDLNKQSLPGETCVETLKRIGSAYRERILGS